MSRRKIDYEEMPELFLSGMSAIQPARQKRKPQITKIKRISKVKSLHVRITATELQLLQEQATQRHLTLSALVRQLLFEHGNTNA